MEDVTSFLLFCALIAVVVGVVRLMLKHWAVLVVIAMAALVLFAAVYFLSGGQ